MTNRHDSRSCKWCRAMRHQANAGRRRVLAHFPRQANAPKEESR